MSDAPARVQPPPLPAVWRPFGVLVASLFFGALLVIVVGAAWLGFDQSTRDRFTFFQIATVFLLGFGIFLIFFAICRSRVEAYEDRVVVINGFRRQVYDWAQLVWISLPPGAPWATIDLADGDTISAMGIQGTDGYRAQRAVRQLRALLDARHPD